MASTFVVPTSRVIEMLVARIEVDQQWQELVEVEQVGVGNHWYVQNDSI
jgi:hypothetical protein